MRYQIFGYWKHQTPRFWPSGRLRGVFSFVGGEMDEMELIVDLPRAPRDPIAFDRRPDDYISFTVPVFKENTSLGIQLGAGELRAITDNCNQIIEETGRFPPVTITHGGDVVGVAGPFSTGILGNLKPKPAVFGLLRIYKKEVRRVNRYPRVSVDYFCNLKRPADGFFEAVSLVGAETPELDLGIRYCMDRRGRRVHRYERAAPNIDPDGMSRLMAALDTLVDSAMDSAMRKAIKRETKLAREAEANRKRTELIGSYRNYLRRLSSGN